MAGMNRDQAKTTPSSLNGSSLSYSLVPRTSFPRHEDIPSDDTTLLMLLETLLSVLFFTNLKFVLEKKKLSL